MEYVGFLHPEIVARLVKTALVDSQQLCDANILTAAAAAVGIARAPTLRCGGT